MIRKWLRKNKEKEIEIDEQETIESEITEQEKPEKVVFTPAKIDLSNTKERISYISNLYEQIKEAKKLCEDTKFEYGQVTSYLKDIQLIDAAPLEQRQLIREVADGIHELTKERNRIQKQKYKITDAQRQAMDAHEDILEKDVKKLQEYEAYQIKVKNDMRQLSGEKNLLQSDKKDIIQRQNTLKVLSKCVAMISVSMLALIVAVYFCFEVEITYPFIGLIGFLLVTLTFIMFESRRNRVDMVITEQKCNRAITLLNKVKIKYVNTFNVISAICNKYNVRNGTELEFIYEQYQKAKREWKKQQASTKNLAKLNEVLMHELQKLRVKDREIWFYQAEALVDDREMVEVRHRLNTQRQMLREHLDYNADIMEKCLNEMDKIRLKSPQYEEEIERILASKTNHS